ncbi:MAG: hypothetical protein ABIQ99_12620 [Thermoflexales bacterium]
MRYRVIVMLAAALLAGCGDLEVLPTAGPSTEVPSAPTRLAAPATRGITPLPLATQLPGAGTSTARATSTATPRPAATGTAVPAPTSSLPRVTPAPGKGNVDGSVVWNGAGAADQEVKLCEDFQLIGGCKGREYSTRTSAAGAYRFAGVEPGEYALAIRPFGAESMIYITSGAITARKFAVEANKTLDIRPQSVYKLDLALGEPRQAAAVTAGAPALNWTAYPSADYYEVYLTPARGDTVLNNSQTRDTSLAATGLLNCEYRWRVSAFNVARAKIAESVEQKFSVAGQAGPCVIPLLGPPNRAPNVAGANVRLEWESHPLAVRYEILMWNDSKPDRPKLLDFASVNEPLYAFTDTLEPARYVWTVYAMDKDGKRIAASETVNFTVSR